VIFHTFTYFFTFSLVNPSVSFFFFLVVLGFWTQGVTLAREALSHLSHSASPQLQCWCYYSIILSSVPSTQKTSDVFCMNSWNQRNVVNLFLICYRKGGRWDNRILDYEWRLAGCQWLTPVILGGRDQEDHGWKPSWANSS
jgi:hypothetical protein